MVLKHLAQSKFCSFQTFSSSAVVIDVGESRERLQAEPGKGRRDEGPSGRGQVPRGEAQTATKTRRRCPKHPPTQKSRNRRNARAIQVWPIFLGVIISR